MPEDSVPPAPPEGPGSFFTVASWVAVFGGLLVTFCVYQYAVAHKSPTDWLPGVGEAIIGIVITGVCAFAASLIALLRKERLRLLALLPFLAGLGTILYSAYSLIFHR
jgi:hypothetical protein